MSTAADHAVKDYRLKNHYVICNWSSKIPHILRELHADIVDNVVTVIVTPGKIDESLLPRTPEERKAFEDVVFYPADPTYGDALRNVNCQHARAVIVLASDEEQAQADARNLLTLFALKELPLVEGFRPHVVVEILDVSNYSKFRQFETDEHRDIEIVRAASLRSRILAQAARTPGLVGFFEQLLTYSKHSNEVYTTEIPASWVEGGVTDFGALCRHVLSLRKEEPSFVGIPVGVVFPLGHPRAGQIDVNPPDDRPVGADAEVVLICAEAPKLWEYRGPKGLPEEGEPPETPPVAVAQP